MFRTKSGKRAKQGFLEYLFDSTKKLILKIQQEDLEDIEKSALNESFVIYLYRLYEKQIKWILRAYRYEDSEIKEELKEKELLNKKYKNFLRVNHYIMFISTLNHTNSFENKDAIDEITNEFNVIRNAITHGEASNQKRKIFEKLRVEQKVFMTGDGYFHPSTEYLLDILAKMKRIILELEQILYDSNKEKV